MTTRCHFFHHSLKNCDFMHESGLSVLTQFPLKHSFQLITRSSYSSFITAAEQNNTTDDTAARTDFYWPFLTLLWKESTLLPPAWVSDQHPPCMSVPQGALLPASVALQGLLSVAPCQLSLTSSLRADSQDLSLDLSQSCRPPRLSGTLTHSVPGLRSRGVPQVIDIEAAAPGGPGQDGALFIKAGTCYIRANRVTEARGGTQWLWALESECPMFQVLEVFLWLITEALTWQSH